MLVLSRKNGERIVIGGNIEVMVLQILDNRVRLGLTAPDDVSIYREEVWLDICRERAETGPAAETGQEVSL